ncbi:MAG: transposase, partial [Ignavibacteriaceae bacterium]|nr:transposase [Ignavibacteriaceae bacterium]
MLTRSFHIRNLPHLYYNEGQYFITYRLVNSIPRGTLSELHNKVQSLETDDNKERLLFKWYDTLLDKSDCCKNYLQVPEIAEIVKGTIIYPDSKDYKLICYCIMPNHVHLVFELLQQNKGISKIMQSIKRISARESNKILGREGKFWQDESFDRLIRHEKELYFTIR